MSRQAAEAMVDFLGEFADVLTAEREADPAPYQGGNFDFFDFFAPNPAAQCDTTVVSAPRPLTDREKTKLTPVLLSPRTPNPEPRQTVRRIIAALLANASSLDQEVRIGLTRANGTTRHATVAGVSDHLDGGYLLVCSEDEIEPVPDVPDAAEAAYIERRVVERRARDIRYGLDTDPKEIEDWRVEARAEFAAIPTPNPEPGQTVRP